MFFIASFDDELQRNIACLRIIAELFVKEFYLIPRTGLHQNVSNSKFSFVLQKKILEPSEQWIQQ
jgi:hypothetical protein